MNNPFKSVFALPKGMLLFLGIYAVIFPVVYVETKLAGHSTLLRWLGLSPSLVWQGEVWRVLTFDLVSSSMLGWASGCSSEPRASVIISNTGRSSRRCLRSGF